MFTRIKSTFKVVENIGHVWHFFGLWRDVFGYVTLVVWADYFFTVFAFFHTGANVFSSSQDDSLCTVLAFFHQITYRFLSSNLKMFFITFTATKPSLTILALNADGSHTDFWRKASTDMFAFMFANLIIPYITVFTIVALSQKAFDRHNTVVMIIVIIQVNDFA
jgi:hypothetical protein